MVISFERTYEPQFYQIGINKKQLFISLLLCLCLAISLLAQYIIKTSAISNGAGLLEDKEKRVVGVSGQAIIGSQRNAAFYLHAGFLHQSGRLITDVLPTPAAVPQAYHLSQNYPNPFNPTTMIEFTVPKTGRVIITVFDLRGRQVAVLVDAIYQAGVYKAVFDARAFASGIYYYRLQAEHVTVVRKALMIK